MWVKNKTDLLASWLKTVFNELHLLFEWQWKNVIVYLCVCLLVNLPEGLILTYKFYRKFIKRNTARKLKVIAFIAFTSALYSFTTNIRLDRQTHRSDETWWPDYPALFDSWRMFQIAACASIEGLAMEEESDLLSKSVSLVSVTNLTGIKTVLNLKYSLLILLYKFAFVICF